MLPNIQKEGIRNGTRWTIGIYLKQEPGTPGVAPFAILRPNGNHQVAFRPGQHTMLPRPTDAPPGTLPSVQWRRQMEIHLRVRGFRLQFAEMECTGVGQVIFESIAIIGATGVVCLTGVGHGGAVPKIATANVASAAVLENNVVFGSVNANKRHWYKAGEALARPSHTILDQSPMDGRFGEGVDCRHHFAKEDMAL